MSGITEKRRRDSRYAYIMTQLHPSTETDSAAPARDRHQRKHRVLSQGLPSVTGTIADAVVLKDGDLFLVTEPDGRLPPGTGHGLGLYYKDCRFLRTYELRLNGTLPTALGATASAGDRGYIQLTNPELEHPGAPLPRDTISIEWARTIDGEALSLVDVLTLHNWGRESIELTLELSFEAGFEDVFEVRGLLDEDLGTEQPPEWDDGRLRIRYHGRDRLDRSVTIVPPAGFALRRPATLAGTVRLEPREERRLELHVLVREWPPEGTAPAENDPDAVARSARGSRPPSQRWPDGTTVVSDSLALDDILERSFADLGLLRSTLHDRTFVAAGIPWFATLFGRDSLIAALQLLPYAPEVARDTLRLLASYQADRVDEWRDAAPGKILHELRVGEMARTGAIPHSPYYGTVDATPLFLIVLRQYVDWSGDLDLFDELHDNVRRALEWIDRYGDSDGDGYVEYRSVSEHGLTNQGWKDSGDAMVDEQGRIATPPIALVEVQGYVYAARLGMADLYQRRGDGPTADRLRQQATGLKSAFDRDFWVEEIGCYAMALEARKEPLRVVSSNAGQALWCGIADPSKAARTAERIMSAEMFSGWGVRTLSQDSVAYNPVAYHLGTVWPHDNSLVGAGLKRYGFGAHTRRIFDGIAAAARDFDHRRVPELWTGFSRDRYASPIRYPVACHPQAWAAGSMPFLLQHLLGLEAHALEHRLRVSEPIMPGLGTWLELRGVRVGEASVDLRFESTDAKTRDTARVDVLAVRGKLEVEIDTGSALMAGVAS
ncbi:MAG: amylo-alpha-1,6-glucosidase [Gemmatimonadales bacterium]